jgi:hypothetical protein
MIAMRVSSFVFCLFMYATASSQTISGLKAELTESNSILLGWTVNAGKTCSDMGLEFAGEDLQFNTAHFIAGVCGSDFENLYYSFEHTQNLSGKSYYRIRYNHDEFSDTIEVITPVNKNAAITLFPQPASRELKISFNEKISNNSEMRIFNPSGQLLIARQLSNKLLEEVDVSKLNPGLYYLFVLSETEIYSAPLLIGR